MSLIMISGNFQAHTIVVIACLLYVCEKTLYLYMPSTTIRIFFQGR